MSAFAARWQAMVPFGPSPPTAAIFAAMIFMPNDYASRSCDAWGRNRGSSACCVPRRGLETLPKCSLGIRSVALACEHLPRYSPDPGYSLRSLLYVRVDAWRLASMGGRMVGRGLRCSHI